MSDSRRRAFAGILGSIALLAGISHGAEEFLWPKGAPGATDTANASKPSVTYYPADPKLANGTAAVICPGGGYDHLAIDKEGYQVAKWLNTLGVAGFVLKYRVAPYRHPIEMNDAQRAMRYVRANAKRYKIDPARVGIVGFSAGGHLASTVATHYDEGNPAAADTVDRQSCKPWFQILVYPVITMEGPFAHAGSRDNLLGKNPAPELLRLLSNEKHVDAKTPPAFLVHTRDDAGVLVDNSIMYNDSLIAAGVPVRMKLFDHGPHGFGLADGVAGSPYIADVSTWPSLCATWMKERGYLAPASAIVDPSGDSEAEPAFASGSRSTGPNAISPALRWSGRFFDFLGRSKPEDGGPRREAGPRGPAGR
jgi:acetyl esterase/lipase